MKAVIRNATQADWKIIQKLNHEVFLDNKQYDPYENINWSFSKDGVKYYKKVVSGKSHITLIAEVNKNPTGYITGAEKNFDYRSNLKAIEVENMGVSPDYRSTGVGAQLMVEFKKIAKQKGFTHVFVDSYYDNQRAISFYQKQGLKPIGLELEGKL